MSCLPPSRPPPSLEGEARPAGRAGLPTSSHLTSNLLASTAPPRRVEDLRGPGFNWLNVVLALGLLGAFVASAQATSFSPLLFFEPGNVKAITRFVGGLFPPELSPDFLRTLGGL